MTDVNAIKNIAIIGAGVQGHEIAQIALMAGFNKVILNDISDNVLKSAKDLILNNKRIGLKKLESKGLLGGGIKADNLLKSLILETNIEKAVSDANFVIEAVPEVMDVKKEVFKKLGNYAPENTILATNTSTMSITEIGKSSNRPEKIIGMHFFAPVEIKLIEITKGKETSDESINIGIAVGEKFPCLEGKRFVVTLEKESPGFIANRVVGVCQIYLNYVLDLAKSKNITYEQLDADIIDIMPGGACLLNDIIGLDTIYNSMKYFEKTLSPDFIPSKIIENLVEQGKLGQKVGQGFYKWKEGKFPKIDTTRKAGLLDIETLIAIQLNEGCRLLEEKIVNGYKVIDDAVSAGYHIPGPFITGKRKYKEYSKKLKNLAEKSGKKYLQPCELMATGKFLDMRK